MKTGTKIIVWTSVIAVVGIGGYLAYKQYQKNKEAEAKGAKKTQLIKDVATGVGSFVSGLFSKKENAEPIVEANSPLLNRYTV
jgi:uncharacterized membrane protein YebE (DUF533 family)